MAATDASPLHSPGHMHVAEERCPFCDQPITHEKLEEIRARVRTEERRRTEAILREQAEKFTAARARTEAKAKADVEAAQREAAAVIEKAQREAATREAALRAQAVADVQKIKSEFVAKEATAREEGRKESAADTAVKLAAVEEARKVAESTAVEMAAGHERNLSDLREALEKDRDGKLNAEKAKHFQEKQKLENTAQDLTRQLQKMTASELGEGAEIDLYEALRGRFEGDKIRPVKSGTAGPDVIHEVVHNGSVCGTIIYDSKNHGSWRNDHVTKLRADQLTLKADCAVMTSNKFPAGAKQIHLQDGIIVANPARVAAIAELLRHQLIQMHQQRASKKERATKMTALYDFITSDRCGSLLESMAGAVKKLSDLDVVEVKAHGAVWKRRGELHKSLEKLHAKMRLEIDTIVGTADPDEGP